MPSPNPHLDPTAQRVLQRSLSSTQQAWLRGEFDDFDRGGAPGRAGFRGRRDGMDSTWTGVAVRRVAEQVGKTPWRLVDDDDNIVESGPLFDLLMVAPNAHQDPRVFVESMVIELLTSVRGSVVVIKDFGLERALVQGGDTRRLLPRELLIADSTRFRAVWTRGGIHPRVSHYEYVVPAEGGYGGSVIPFAPQELIAIALPGGAARLDPLDGLSMRIGAEEAQGLDREMMRYSTEYFAHDASPGTVLMTDSALSPAQIRQMRRDWDQRHRGASWRSAVLHKGLKIAPSPPIKDLAMPEMAKQVRERQLAIHDTPPIVAGIVDDANRSNSDAQIAMFIYGAVASVADRIDTALTRHLIAAHPWPTAGSSRDGSGGGARLIVSHARRDALRGMRAAARSMCERNHRSMLAVDRMPEGAAKRMLYNPLEGGPQTALTLVHDVDSHPAVARVKLEALASAIQLVANGQPLNDVLDLLDIPVPRRPEGDVARIPFSVAPAAALDEFDPAEPEDGDGEQGVGSRQQRILAARQRMLHARDTNAAVTTTSAPGSPGAAAPTPVAAEVRAPSAPAGRDAAPGSGSALAASGHTPPSATSASSAVNLSLLGAMARAYACAPGGDECACGASDQARGIAERHRATVAPIAREFEHAVRAHLRRQRDELLGRVRKEIEPAQVQPQGASREARGTRATIDPAALERVVFDLRAEQGRIVAALRPTLQRAARLGAAQGAFEAGIAGGVEAANKAAGLMLRDPNIRLSMDKVGARMRLIEGRRLSEVQDTIRAAFRDESKTFNDLLQDLKRYYDGEFTSARRAAMTETASVTNTARYESMREQGVDGKLWLTASGRPRASHAAAEQTYGTTPIPIDQPFIVNGHPMRFPGDPDAPAGERISCYCVQLAAFIAEPDQERAMRTRELRFLRINDLEPPETRDAA